jgi:hypothetical protein
MPRTEDAPLSCGLTLACVFISALRQPQHPCVCLPVCFVWQSLRVVAALCAAGLTLRCCFGNTLTSSTCFIGVRRKLRLVCPWSAWYVRVCAVSHPRVRVHVLDHHYAQVQLGNSCQERVNSLIAIPHLNYCKLPGVTFRAAWSPTKPLLAQSGVVIA